MLHSVFFREEPSLPGTPIQCLAASVVPGGSLGCDLSARQLSEALSVTLHLAGDRNVGLRKEPLPQRGRSTALTTQTLSQEKRCLESARDGVDSAGSGSGAPRSQGGQVSQISFQNARLILSWDCNRTIPTLKRSCL